MTNYVDWFTTAIKTALKESIIEGFQWIMSGIVTNIVYVSHAVALVGGGILIILYIGGYKSALQKTGILIVSYTMIKYLLG
jgi:hypothetical protein